MTHVRRSSSLPALCALVLLAALTIALVLAPEASASKYVAIKGAKAPGPKVFDKVFIDKHGPRKADTVMVLIPGTGGGAGSVAPIASDLSRKVDGLQVWGFDRRQQAFEDTTGFEDRDPDAATAYYLSLQYDRVTGDQVPFVADWGFKTEMNDLRRVIRKAGKGGRKVILGGHSRGASSVVAYASWDFRTGPGFEALDGLVLIDGGLAAFGAQDLTLAQSKQRLQEIRDGDIFSDPLGAGIPEIGPIFAQIAALYAAEKPNEPSALQANPLVVAAGLAPPFPVTNEGFLGYTFDKTYSQLGAALHIRAGLLEPQGPTPRGWVSGENTPIENFATAFSRDPANATEWYYPNRMILDTNAANALGRTPAARFLGLRLFHTKRIDTPLYAFQTDLTDGGVLDGARTVIRKSRIERSKLVDATRGSSHLDPVIAPLKRNRMTKTLIPFLKGLTR